MITCIFNPNAENYFLLNFNYKIKPLNHTMIQNSQQNSVFGRMFSTAGKQREKRLQMLKNAKKKHRKKPSYLRN